RADGPLDEDTLDLDGSGPDARHAARAPTLIGGADHLGEEGPARLEPDGPRVGDVVADHLEPLARGVQAAQSRVQRGQHGALPPTGRWPFSRCAGCRPGPAPAR